MTVITIVLIAIVLGVGTVIVSSVLNNTKKSSACSSAGGVWYGGKCFNPNDCKTDESDNKTSCSGTPMEWKSDTETYESSN